MDRGLGEGVGQQDITNHVGHIHLLDSSTRCHVLMHQKSTTPPPPPPCQALPSPRTPPVDLLYRHHVFSRRSSWPTAGFPPFNEPAGSDGSSAWAAASAASARTRRALCRAGAAMQGRSRVGASDSVAGSLNASRRSHGHRWRQSEGGRTDERAGRGGLGEDEVWRIGGSGRAVG